MIDPSQILLELQEHARSLHQSPPDSRTADMLIKDFTDSLSGSGPSFVSADCSLSTGVCLSVDEIVDMVHVHAIRRCLRSQISMLEWKFLMKWSAWFQSRRAAWRPQRGLKMCVVCFVPSTTQLCLGMGSLLSISKIQSRPNDSAR